MASYEISPDLNKLVKEMAEVKGCTAQEAAEYLITKGVQKYNAEHKYIAKVAKADKAPKAKKAKAAPAKKTAKAKGPIARKGGGKKAKKEGGAEAVAL